VPCSRPAPGPITIRGHSGLGQSGALLPDLTREPFAVPGSASATGRPAPLGWEPLGWEPLRWAPLPGAADARRKPRPTRIPAPASLDRGHVTRAFDAQQLQCGNSLLYVCPHLGPQALFEVAPRLLPLAAIDSS